MRKQRKVLAVLLLVILISAVYTGIVSTAAVQAENTLKTTLENVRDYAPTSSTIGAAATRNYAIDGGYLYVGVPNQWREVTLPDDVIAGAVAVDPYNQDTVYLGAANQMALYLSRNRGESWERIPLDSKYLGGVTDIAINGAQRTVYVGTDNSGIYRLRDVGSSMILNGHTPLNEPVVEIVADQLGAGLIFARTEWKVYRGINNGQQWLPLDGLATTPTALAVANSHPAIAYIGTTDRGLLWSSDGFTWQLADAALQTEPGTRLHIDALAVDPADPALLYVARSYLFGHTSVHQQSLGVDMSVDGGLTWQQVAEPTDVAVTELLPVSGVEGAVFALSDQSRAPVALGNATNLPTPTISPRPTYTAGGQFAGAVSLSAWIVAAAAAAALAWLMMQEWQQQPLTATVKIRS